MLNKSTLNFLKELNKNNNREWFSENKAEYENANQDMIAFVEKLLSKMKVFDNSLNDVIAKKCIFRIYRDVRFSKDKSPYKNNFGASISSGGKNLLRAGYYVHIQPGNKSFAGGGLYMPPSPLLKAVRQEIAYNTEMFTGIIENKKFKKTFGELWGDKTKNAPREYDSSHPAIELLKYKSYIVGVDFTDKEVLSEGFEKQVLTVFKELSPFNKFLNDAIVDVK